MEKNVRKPLRKTISELLYFICISSLLVSSFSFTALAEDANSSSSINSNDKISTSLSSKLGEISETEKVPIIIELPNQSIKFNTAAGKSQIESEQKNLVKFLESEKSKSNAQEIKSIKLINAIAVKVTPGVVASLAKRSDVARIEPDQIVSIPEQPETSLEKIKTSTTQTNTASTNAWGVDKIDAPAVWQRGITGKGITVAVVDTGIDATHPDLDDLDDSSSTNDPKVVGWIDYVSSESSAYDDNGHGTHVSGTISGTGANGIQTGVAPGTKLIVAKVFDSEGSGYLSDSILGFEWAINNNANIISYSGGSSEHSSLFTTTINKVVAAGIVPVIAAGNDGLYGSGTINCPGDELNSVTVGATDSSNSIAYFSSRGPVTLNDQTYIKPDVSAPGVSVPSTYPGDGYASGSGTSMATPHVSGTAALILQKNPTMKPSEVKQKLESTAKNLGSTGKDNDYGSGLINAYKAVFGSTSSSPVANFSASPTSGKVPLTVAFTDTSTGTPTKWKWSFGDGTTSVQQNPIHKYSKAGNYTVALTATNTAGSNTVTKTNYVLVVSKPAAAFSAYPTSGKAPLTVAFTDTSTGTPTKWKWSFGDGTTSVQQNPKHKYSKAGNYTVALTAANAVGSSTVTKTNHIVVVSKPAAAFSAYPTSGKAPLTVAFTDKSSGNPTAYKWSFGDGTVSREKNPKYQYLQEGNYKVTLTVSNAAGSSTVTKTNYITVTTNTRPGIYAESK
ncbi:S8 family peptidase [Methanosarcina sp.]|uniref:S8 family peptidase n=1 Tax=Methanosarcina sp. TaxID=2213 RepID=UPI002988AB5A|nr:S8 family serine peptidase [Methanosarcina sp.]MDW5549084.1 S8 family serine peptidase [Methanosarcina sp.]MDW5552787.1 S8 family serine peptidase [Methanosarcina sp.]MDW5559529.1 S8 family serine peptidase [Methanosarcina sp.]